MAVATYFNTQESEGADRYLHDDAAQTMGRQPLLGIGDDMIRLPMCPLHGIGGIADIKYMGES